MSVPLSSKKERLVNAKRYEPRARTECPIRSAPVSVVSLGRVLGSGAHRDTTTDAEHAPLLASHPRSKTKTTIEFYAMGRISRELPHTVSADHYAATVAFLRSGGSAVRCTLRRRGDGTVSFTIMTEDELLSVSEQRRLVDFALQAAGWDDRQLFVDVSKAGIKRRMLRRRATAPPHVYSDSTSP